MNHSRQFPPGFCLHVGKKCKGMPWRHELLTRQTPHFMTCYKMESGCAELVDQDGQSSQGRPTVASSIMEHDDASALVKYAIHHFINHPIDTTPQ